jgi:GNAT superfamily N-acetyltransferase
METKYITLNAQNLDAEHICCGFSDKKIKEGYEKKKSWLKNEMERGYVFRRLDEKAKVFIEYVPAENAWLPVEAKGYLMINCFWVSGQYKGKGHGKALLKSAVDDACAQGCAGLVTVVGTKKLPFMSDTKWLFKQGFEVVETLPHGFALLVLKLKSEAALPLSTRTT